MTLAELMATEQDFQETLARWEMEDRAREVRMKELDELERLTEQARKMRQTYLIIPGKWARIRVHYLEEEKPAQWIAQMEGVGAQGYLEDIEDQYSRMYQKMKEELMRKNGLNHEFQEKDFQGYTQAMMELDEAITEYLTLQLTEQV